jgi:hypothetical protein
MISMAEVKLRAANAEWEQAKRDWTVALSIINRAKLDWQLAQDEFFGEIKIASAAACGGCTGCSTGGGCK